MPREKRVLRTPRKLTQKSIEGYFGTSSPQPPSSPPAQPPKKKRRGAVSQPKASKAKARKGTLPRSSPAHDDGEASSSSEVAAITFEPINVDSSSEDDDQGDSPRRPAATQRRLRLRRAASDSENVISENDSNEDGNGPSIARKGKGKEKSGKHNHTTITSSEDEEPQPKKKKLIKGVRPLTPEVVDLREEVDERKIIESRFRNRSKTSAFQRNLERLRRKKRGERMDSESEPSDEESDHDTPFTHAKPSQDASDEASDKDSQADNEEDDTFIVEDDNDAPELPAEFSMSAHQDIKHHFKIVCQLFVHVAVQDVENRRSCMKQLLKDQYFSIPLAATRRKIIGMRDSLVASSVWRTEFKRPLETYPEIEIVHLSFAEPHCDACHLGGRLSTRTARVKGSPYDPLTFESIEEEEEEGPDSNDEDGEDQKPKKEFRLGRFCAARTHAFHCFTHWEYILFKALEREIDGLRNRTTGSGRGPNSRIFYPVAFAGGIKPPDDLTDADGMMAWLDSRKIIDMEWQRIREMMDKARKLDISAKRGEDDDGLL